MTLTPSPSISQNYFCFSAVKCIDVWKNSFVLCPLILLRKGNEVPCVFSVWMWLIDGNLKRSLANFRGDDEKKKKKGDFTDVHQKPINRILNVLAQIFVNCH